MVGRAEHGADVGRAQASRCVRAERPGDELGGRTGPLFPVCGEPGRDPVHLGAVRAMCGIEGDHRPDEGGMPYGQQVDHLPAHGVADGDHRTGAQGFDEPREIVGHGHRSVVVRRHR